MTRATPATPSDRPRWRWLQLGLFLLVLITGMAWVATAIVVQLSGPLRWFGLAAVLGAGGVAFALRRRSRAQGWAVVAIAALAVAGWYLTLHPRADRNWAADVAHGVTAQVEGRQVTLHDVRAFDWQTADQAVERWETRSYDLADLSTVDLFTSVWDNPEIAHVLVSFGFGSGRHVVFSAEIRREAGEEFSQIGGFFRQFELVLIAAEESDIVRLRTTLRREDVTIYPVALNPDQRRALFLGYLDLGNDLAARPRWYNTITANCTTVVFRMARALKTDLPLDVRLLLSARLPGYLAALGLLPGPATPEERRAQGAISARAQGLLERADFSAGIRVGMTAAQATP